MNTETLRKALAEIGRKGGLADTEAQRIARAKPKGGGRPKGAKDRTPRARKAKREAGGE